MKYLMMIIVVLMVVFLTGCSAFEVQHLERLACHNGGTPWANDTKRDKNGVYWYINKTGWRGKQLSKDVPCVRQVMTKKRLAMYN